VSDTVIRRAGARDAAVLARLRYDFRAAHDPPVEARDIFLDRCSRWMAARLAAPGSWRCWLAERSDRAVGTAWLQLIEKLPNPVDELERHAYISSLYVEPESRGDGVGSALLRACLDACASEQVDAVILWPTPRSRSLYERHGFMVRDDLLEQRLDPTVTGTQRRGAP
jgi:GNAT superfamily N-acetyltransferase